MGTARAFTIAVAGLKTATTDRAKAVHRASLLRMLGRWKDNHEHMSHLGSSRRASEALRTVVELSACLSKIASAAIVGLTGDAKGSKAKSQSADTINDAVKECEE